MATRAALFHAAPVSPRPSLTLVQATPLVAGARFDAARAPNWPIIGGIVAAHIVLGAGLMATGTIKLAAPEKPVIVSLIPETVAPSPPEVDVPLQPVPVEVFVPDVLVQTEAIRTSPIVVTNVPPPKAVVAPSVAATPGPPVAAPVTPPDFDADQLDNPGPRYPAMSRRNHEQGTTIVRVLVSLEGRPQQISLQTSSGFKRLDEAALEAIKRWKFLPAKQAGRPVTAWVEVPFNFALDT